MAVPGKSARHYAGSMARQLNDPLPSRATDAEEIRHHMRRVSVVLAAILVLAILLFTLSPGDAYTSGSWLLDKMADIYGTRQQASWVLHAGLFALLGASLALWFASSPTSRRAPRRTLLMLVLAIWIFAAADEIAQGWIEGRSASLGDWIADMVGVLIGLMLAPLVLRPLLRLLMR
jgi:VanZ family protein